MTYAAIASSILCAIAFVTSGTAWGADQIGVGTIQKINEVAASCAAEPMRGGGTIYYYCDCGAGAEAGCVAGDDSNAGTDPAHPRRTIASAATLLRTQAAVNDTVALCKGGAFNAASSLYIGSNRCGAGNVCNDLREYTPSTFAGSNKPLINNAAGAVSLFTITGDVGGLRIMNLKLVGDNGALANGNKGFFFYTRAHDVSVCNVDMDLFDMAVYNESNNGVTNNIRVNGNRITNTRRIAFLGGGDNFELNYNYWDGNGGTNKFDHTLYFGTSEHVVNIQSIGNYIHGQYGPVCLGAPVVGHAMIDGLIFKDNVVVVEAAQADPGCWGVAFNNITGAAHAIYYRNAVFSGNTIINGGNNALTVSSCPGCLIENNLVIQDWAAGGALGISVVDSSDSRTPGLDDPSNANIVRNNTVWFGPNATGTTTGIRIYKEGAGHVSANNTVSSAQATGTMSCFDYRLAPSSYAYINNNHCHSALAYSWEKTRGSLSAWQSYAAGSGFDTNSFTGNPLLVAPGSDFSPSSGSPLVGAGNALHGAALDLTGQVRPNPPAIGAFEKQGPGRISVPAARKVSEGAAYAKLRIDRTSGTIGAIGVDFATGNGTALAGTDYTITSGTLSWADGDGSPKFISVPILHDATPEPTRAFTVALSNPSGSATLGNSLATVTLYDDDPATPFPDATNSTFLSYINAIYGAGITTGCGGGSYCPGQAVTRAQLAAFLIRALEADPVAGYCGSTAPFADVPVGSTFCGHIKRLKELAITTGCGGGNYCPASNVTRDQMAVFVIKSMEGSVPANYCGAVAPFSDVPANHWACGHIKRLSELAITTGCGSGKYCPTAIVSREQMAAFLARAFLGM